MALNSFSFILITFAAILACRLCAPRLMRELVVLLLSLYFLATFITEWDQLALLAAFLAIVYLLGVSKAANASFWSIATSFLIVALFWSALFLLKDPNLLGAVNPFHAHPVKLIGISYIVFRAITFVLEVAPGDRLSPLTFLNYMIFFPTLLAGPIERFHRFNETTDQPVPLEPASFDALNRVLNGFIKKFVIADNFMDLGIFSMMPHANDLSTPVLWIGAISTLALLYLDFVGYCDIVIGVSALMGFRIVENFNAPFASRNLQEFWGRWHMSLGSVIQDYVFSPLSKAVFVNIPREKQMYAIASIYVVTMVLVAMWHGTTIGFLIFGILQGAVLFAIQIRREFARARAKASGVRYAASQTALSLWTGRISTYAFVSLTMIWWQGSLPDAIMTYQRLVGWH
ncbi:MBOAT family O-acyltransferase [Bradyrhizobium erythrophlei]|uniref:Probable alginate O-acetylase AlgI n=1 Tax=Bradyrhizobium erythrophlei TaxID=1437360 RepID=A0A1H5HTG3_9BRAD|nr:MBOAT family O-acyltransferase [Bradyrhizobium erythrophlei]SEE31104.1 alginate O-acetyltransferase complex protein AlgI [Bradyrhizobium erythrophlei]